MALNQYESFLKENTIEENTSRSNEITQIGKKIAQAAQSYYDYKGASEYLKDYQWEFKLVENSQRNACCMQGCKIAFYTGISPIAKNKDGIAAIMDHEVAHALLNHGGQRMSIALAQQGMNIVALKTTEKQPEKKRKAIMTAYGIGTTVVAVLPFSRKHETQADRIGLELMAIAGFNVAEAPKLWERMQAASQGKAPPEILSTHPSNQRRIQDLTVWTPKAIELAQQLRSK